MTLDTYPRPDVVERILTDLARDASITPAQRFLRDNSAAIRRAHAEMLAEREQGRAA